MPLGWPGPSLATRPIRYPLLNSPERRRRAAAGRTMAHHERCLSAPRGGPSGGFGTKLPPPSGAPGGLLIQARRTAKRPQSPPRSAFGGAPQRLAVSPQCARQLARLLRRALAPRKTVGRLASRAAYEMGPARSVRTAPGEVPRNPGQPHR